MALKNREQLNQQKNNLLSQLNEDEIKNLRTDIDKEKIERYKKLKLMRIKKVENCLFLYTNRITVYVI